MGLELTVESFVRAVKTQAREIAENTAYKLAVDAARSGEDLRALLLEQDVAFEQLAPYFRPTLDRLQKRREEDLGIYNTLASVIPEATAVWYESDEFVLSGVRQPTLKPAYFDRVTTQWREYSRTSDNLIPRNVQGGPPHRRRLLPSLRMLYAMFEVLQVHEREAVAHRCKNDFIELAMGDQRYGLTVSTSWSARRRVITQADSNTALDDDVYSLPSSAPSEVVPIDEVDEETLQVLFHPRVASEVPGVLRFGLGVEDVRLQAFIDEETEDYDFLEYFRITYAPSRDHVLIAPRSWRDQGSARGTAIILDPPHWKALRD